MSVGDFAPIGESPESTARTWPVFCWREVWEGMGGV